LTLFRRTDKLGVLQGSIFFPKDYRLFDALDLSYYIDYENELEKESESIDYFDNELTSFHTYYSSAQPLLSNCRRHLMVEIYGKPSTFRHIIDHVGKKQNKLLCDVCV